MMTVLKKALQQNNTSLDDSICEHLITYLEQLIKWNKVINLTSITDFHDMVYLHIIDSLLIAPYIHGTRCLDVGSGAGLPGIPLAIMLPHIKWVLLDKCAKKTRFLLQMKAELGLKNVEVVESRAERFHPEQRFDSIITRAYGTLRLLTESTAHLLAQDGVWLLMKGKYPQEELDDLPSSVNVRDIQSIKMNGKTLERHLVSLTAS